MMIQAVLSNPNHPEYGVATIPFPIPHDQYAHCMELLEALEVGDAVKADCKVEKIDSFYTVLKRTKMLTVNVEELNYLAKRLDGFDAGEAAQFQAMAHKLELFELKDLINLTFCCQQATVITDFSDLAAIGRDHYMNLHGGCASVDELNALDGEKTARQFIESGSGTITPYGVVYDNGMKLLIKISESSYTIGDDGRLAIPADDLTEMGLTAGQDVFVAYITDDGLANRYHEFTVSSVSLSELDTTQQIAIPQQLLEQAGIDSNAEVQIACIDGAIIITGDTPLTENELSEVVGRLRAVNDLTEHFPSELDTKEGGTGYGHF